MRRTGILLAALAAAAGLSGCYLAQAAGGQLGLLSAARPLEAVRSDPATPPRLRSILGRVPAMKRYARVQGLRATSAYRAYAALDRPAAAWLVQACAPLAFEPRRWTFPVVGSVPYLGFFDEASARAEAARLAREEGLDVAVRPASAYSTLGWFADPILSTMVPAGDAALGELADTLFHESVHATVYLPDQSPFDEGLASFVAGRLTLPWLTGTLGPAAPEVVAWRAAVARSEASAARYRAAWLELDALYRSPASEAEKRTAKAARLEGLRRELGLATAPNNATLAGYATYGAGAEGFERLLAACGGRWPRLLGAVAALRPEDFGRPQRLDFDPVLDRLAEAGCPASANLAAP